MAPKHRKRGRPALPKGTSLEGRLIFRMLESELAEIEAAARAASETKSEWGRRVLLAAARAKR